MPATTMFHGKWILVIASALESATNQSGTFSISNYEMAGLFFKKAIIENICLFLANKHIGLFIENSLLVGLTECIATN